MAGIKWLNFNNFSRPKNLENNGLKIPPFFGSLGGQNTHIFCAKCGKLSG